MGRRIATVVWTAKTKLPDFEEGLMRIVEIKDTRGVDELVLEMSTSSDSLGVPIWRKCNPSDLGDTLLMTMILGRIGAKVEVVEPKTSVVGLGGGF